MAELDFPVNGIAFASPDVGLLVEAEQIFRTEDGGATWEHQASPQSPLNDVAFADATTAVAVGQSGAIIRSEDGGAT
ncbi:MAG: hypothetical protein GWN71_28385, partial [Gammaproteobacteria bacterium]|nr:hypothetical protein [Gemmatimonadota bacterium]NIU77328.1 hypothetical protein [Gammaproteobacteria bacterium]NIX23003.1 hypothetical protein [Actinomycetota bacterium]